MDPEFLLWRSQPHQNQIRVRLPRPLDGSVSLVRSIGRNLAIVPANDVHAHLLGQHPGSRVRGAGGATKQIHPPAPLPGEFQQRNQQI